MYVEGGDHVYSEWSGVECMWNEGIMCTRSGVECMLERGDHVYSEWSGVECK